MSVKAIASVCLTTLLVACGQRGPLFLPDEAPVEVRQTSGPARSQTPATQPSEPVTKEAAEPSTTEVPPPAEPAPKPEDSDEATTGTNAGKPR